MKNVGIKRIATIAGAALALSISGFQAANATLPPQTRSLPDGSSLFMVSCDNSTTAGQLGQFDVATGLLTNVGTGSDSEYAHNVGHTNQFCAGGATYNQVTKTAYWFNWRYDGSFSTSPLFSINPTTGVSTYIGNLTTGETNARGMGPIGQMEDARGLTSDSSGNTYVLWAGDSGSHFWVGKVNLSTAAITDVVAVDSAGATLFGFAAYGFTYNPADGHFYVYTYYDPAKLVQINVATGETSLPVTAEALDWTAEGMSFDSHGILWGVQGSSNRLMSISVADWNTSTAGQVASYTPWFSEASFIVTSDSVGPMLPDPVQQSSITSSSADTTTVGSPATVTVNGNFVEKVSAIQVNGAAIAANSWTQTASSISFPYTAKVAGTYSVQIFDGAAPALKAQVLTFKAVAKPTPATVKMKKESFIHCSKSGVGTRIVHGIDPVCPTGYHLGDI